jgi:hypothetical protein
MTLRGPLEVTFCARHNNNICLASQVCWDHNSTTTKRESVCVRERERERENEKIISTSTLDWLMYHTCSLCIYIYINVQNARTLIFH